MEANIIIKKLSLGAFVGCFIVLLVMSLGSYINGPENVIFSGVEVIRAFIGSIVVGWAFSLAGLIYDNEDIAFPLQVLFQNGCRNGRFICSCSLLWMDANKFRNWSSHHMDCYSIAIRCCFLVWILYVL